MDPIRKYKAFAAWCFVFVAVLNLLDLVCTYCFMARYGTEIEMNPFVVSLWNCNPLVFVLYKVAASALFIGCGLFWRRFKKWCIVVVVPTAAYFCVVGVSLYLMFTLPL